MPFMKLGLDRKTGLDRVLTSWRSNDDPRQGNFTRSMDPTGYPQLFLYKNGAPYWRGGPWTGQRWSGLPQTVNSYITNGRFINDENELTFSYELKNQSLFSRIVIEPSGLIQSFTWHDREQRWILFASIPVEQCDFYGTCGPNSNCNPYNISQFACTCLPGFEPKSPADWQLRDGSGGCVRPPGISTCERGEGFVRMARVKVPDTSQARVDMTMNLKECEQECLKNCSCKAYTSADERNGGSGCLAWYGEDLLDTRTFSDMGQDLYVRVDAATLASLSKKGDSPRKRIVIATAVACIILALLLSFTLFILKRRRESRRERSAAMASAAYLDNDQSRNMNDIKDGTEKLDLSLFDLSTVWECWKGGRCLDIVDPSLGGDYPEHEVLRCIRIGLLCVQEFTMDRPTMSAVVFMLGNKVSLPTPNQPSSALNRRRDTSSSSGERTNSMNQVSLTTIEPR
ncbi:hypothetical protein SAY87_008795 [Trapa incisa]|uniref:non-specific serine/threonine protein kinase n=1 Tax=Trapa incisa TaxID=236973 RepID=A0AAN7JUW0_9MYRT|nr:hypothetical protein SAY87_008795 [Trapa incisa]